MTRFAAFFQRTAAANHLRQFGEPVNFYADGLSVGVPRMAVVIRDPIAVYQELGRQPGPGFIVKFLNDAATGVLFADANPEVSCVELPDKVGELPVIRQVVQVLPSKPGWTSVYVQ